MGKALEITDSNFEQEVLKEKLPVLVDFWATWCGPCLMMAPIVEEIAKQPNFHSVWYQIYSYFVFFQRRKSGGSHRGSCPQATFCGENRKDFKQLRGNCKIVS